MCVGVFSNAARVAILSRLRTMGPDGGNGTMNESRTRVRRLVLLALTLWACVIWLKNSEVAEAATGQQDATEEQENN